MKKSILTLTLLAFSFQAANAQWWNSNKKIEGNGNYSSETRTVSDYDQVNLQGSIDVVLIAGTEGNLKIEAESNLLEYIVTEVQGNTLKISVEEGVNLEPSRNQEILITVPFESLEGVSLTGSGDINSSDEIRADNFAVQVTGSGDVNLVLNAETVEGKVVGSGDLELKGSATELEFMVSGSGDIEASGLKASRAMATVSGSGDIAVHATEALRSRVAGSGDIIYSGNPQKQDFKTSGSGSISGR